MSHSTRASDAVRSREQIIHDEGATLDFSQRMSYSDYLSLDLILKAQTLRSSAHDEMLFIVQHQVSELWMKLALHELRSAMQCIDQDDLPSAFKMLARVSRVFEQLIHAWSVLETMTPPEYNAVRAHLGASSGFQSWQYRCMEFSFGNKSSAMLQPHAHRPDLLALVMEAYESPSLYDRALRWMARRGLDLPTHVLDRDWRQPYVANAEVEKAWLEVYRAPEAHWDLYQLGEKLADLESAFRLWRFRHLVTVERVIGLKRGTGGTSGVGYLRGMLDTTLFPEIWTLRTNL